MRILVLGVDGIAGSALVKHFPEGRGTSRHPGNGESNVLPNVDITKTDDLKRALDWASPDAVINGVGILKTECAKNDPNFVHLVNAEAPHVLARLTESTRCRVVHLSSDCVFDGTRGGRTEKDTPDAPDLYGRTKAQGELRDYAHCVTLRTSFIGRDYAHKRGLLEWLLAQGREAPGYANAIWSGVSMPELARVIEMVLKDEQLSGMYHVSGHVVSKANLLRLLVTAYNMDCRIVDVNEPRIDRSLDDTMFRRRTGYVPPSLLDMVKELADGA